MTRLLVVAMLATSAVGWQPSINIRPLSIGGGVTHSGGQIQRQLHMQAYLQSHTRLIGRHSGSVSRLHSYSGSDGDNHGSEGLVADGGLNNSSGGRIKLPLKLRSRSVLRRSISNRRSSALASWSLTEESSSSSAAASTSIAAKKKLHRINTRLASFSQAARSHTAGYLEALPVSRISSMEGIEKEQQKGKGKRIHWFKGLKEDWKKRKASYKSDWTDGMTGKTVPAVLFLYFACILPAVAFGGIANQVTGGAIGVIEYLIACGTGGAAFAIFSGQPMTFIGPTGLTLAFISALASFTSVLQLPFLPLYAWVGVWTAFMLMALSAAGACDLIDYATQFTDDVFNALLAVNFIYEALRSLARNFVRSPGHNKTAALVSLNLALATYGATITSVKVRDSSYFNRVFREIISDFGPVIVILTMGALTGLPSMRPLGIEFLTVPTTVQLCNNRPWIVPMLTVPIKQRLFCALPAILLTSLFYLDQNISSRVVNSPKNHMKKGEAYHIDLFVLGLITLVLSVFGLPWQCAATVQSLNHVRAMTTTRRVPVTDSDSSTESPSSSPSTASTVTTTNHDMVKEAAVAAATAAAVDAAAESDGCLDATAAAAGAAAAKAALAAAAISTTKITADDAAMTASPTSDKQNKKAQGKEEFVGITETRVTGLTIHLAVLASLGLLPVLRMIPMPVVSGIFLYLGRKVMSGNGFLNRIKELAADQSLLSPASAIKKLGYKVCLKYTLVQVAMLSLLWTLKSFKQTALFFPSVIGLLIIMRLAVLPKIFTDPQLKELDAAVG